ncbi:MAG: hypothetical protein AAFV77_08165 [Planctomycetota bacterium]
MNDLLQPPPIEPLPPAPLLERFLLEQPLLPAIILGLLAVVAFIAFSNSGKRKVGLAVAAGLVLAAGAVYLTATLVTTTRETLLERTAELIGSTASADTAALARVLTDDASLNSSGDLARTIPSIDNVPSILSRVDQALSREFVIDRWVLADRQATLDGPNTGRTLVRVGVDGSNFSRTHYSWWRLHWERGSDGEWRCYEIEPRWVQFVGSAAPGT